VLLGESQDSTVENRAFSISVNDVSNQSKFLLLPDDMKIYGNIMSVEDCEVQFDFDAVQQ
jgi:hypothetical protein